MSVQISITETQLVDHPLRILDKASQIVELDYKAEINFLTPIYLHIDPQIKALPPQKHFIWQSFSTAENLLVRLI